MSTFEQEFIDLQSEIEALESEIKFLSSDHDVLFKEVAAFEADNKHRNLSKPTINIKRQHRASLLDYSDPPLITDSIFDASIASYFTDAAESKLLQRPHSDSLLLSIEARAANVENILYENVARFGGITAFAINGYLYNPDDDGLLGLRFDQMSHHTRKFTQSHYVILRRRILEHKSGSTQDPEWVVFRHTIPAYILLANIAERISSEAELQHFAARVREELVKVQYKGDKLDSLDLESANLKDAVVVIDRDLECRVVKIQLKLGNMISELQLTCGPDVIDEVVILKGLNRAAEYFARGLINTPFRSLTSNMTAVLQGARPLASQS